MSEPLYAVVYDGRISDGADLDAVKQRMAALFNLAPSQVEYLFKGRVTLKKNVSAEYAQRFAAAMLAVGAVAQVVPAPARTRAATPTTATLSAEDLARAFEGELEPQPLSAAYSVVLLLTALLLLGLAAAYLGVIGAVLAGVIGYGMSGALTAAATPALQVLFALPPAAGVIVALFLFKPLLARRLEERAPLTITRAEQPVLFAFIDAIADRVGAPTVCRIEVDCMAAASAAYPGGLRGLRKDELALVLGLPMLYGLNTRQLAGALAHELGHFAPRAQRTAMLAQYLIRRINYVFYAAVESRDAWDARLSGWAERKRVLAPFARVVQRGNAGVRRLLRGFLWAARMLSAPVLRRMEHDADAAAARLIGSAQFRAMSVRLRELDWAFDTTYAELDALWNRRRLVDDFPAAIAHKLAEPSPALAAQIEEALSEEHQNVFARHPPNETRIAAAEAREADGVFILERPAYHLLVDPAALARRASVCFYRHTLGIEITPAQLVSRETMATVVTQVRQQDAALQDYCRSLFIRGRYLAPTPRPKVDDEIARRFELNALIRKIRGVLPDMDALKEEQQRLEAQLPAAFAAQVLVQASPSSRGFALKLAPRAYAELQADLLRLNQELSTPRAILMRRIALALEGASQWDALSAIQRASLGCVMRVTRALQKLQDGRDELVRSCGVLRYALQADAVLRKETRNEEHLPASFTEIWYHRSRQCADEIEAVLKRLPYPLESPAGARSMWEHVCEPLPPAHDSPQEVVVHLSGLVVQMDAVHEQLLRHLADVALRYERYLKVDPLSIVLTKAPAAYASC